jgi:hypothetical protein
MMLYSVIVLINILLLVAFDAILFNVNMSQITTQMAHRYETVNLRLYIQIICLGIASLITFIIVNAYRLDDLPHPSMYITFNFTIASCFTLFILQHRFIRSITHILSIILNTVEMILYEIMVPYYNFDAVINRPPHNTDHQEQQPTAQSPIIVNHDADNNCSPTDDGECKICFIPNSIIVVLNCKHAICIDCAKSWLSQKKSCPFCRTTNISVEQTQETTHETSMTSSL